MAVAIERKPLIQRPRQAPLLLTSSEQTMSRQRLKTEAWAI